MAGLSHLCMRRMQQRLSSRGIMVIGNDHGSQGSSVLRCWSSNTSNSDQSEDKSTCGIAVTHDQSGQKSKLARRRREDHCGETGNLVSENVFDEVLPEQLFGRVKESDKAYKLKLEVPGLTKEGLKITIEDGCLLIEGERREEEDNTTSLKAVVSVLRRSPCSAAGCQPGGDKGRAQARVLYITIPKAGEGEKKGGRQIKMSDISI